MRYLSIIIVTILFALKIASAADNNDREKFLIQGTIEIAKGITQEISANDRLIIKLFHPGKDGLEMDTTYRIMDSFTLPLDFAAGPAVGMSGSTKHKTYIIEVFTDTDKDVLSRAPDELFVSSENPIKLGTKNVSLKLKSIR